MRTYKMYIEVDSHPDCEELTIDIEMSYEPADGSVGISHGQWVQDGDITDQFGDSYDVTDIEDLYKKAHGKEIDWGQISNELDEEEGDERADAQIEAYEGRKW